MDNTQSRIDSLMGKFRLYEDILFIVDALKNETVPRKGHEDPESVDYAWKKLVDLIYQTLTYDNKRQGENHVLDNSDKEIH